MLQTTVCGRTAVLCARVAAVESTGTCISSWAPWHQWCQGQNEQGACALASRQLTMQSDVHSTVQHDAFGATEVHSERVPFSVGASSSGFKGDCKGCALACCHGASRPALGLLQLHNGPGGYGSSCSGCSPRPTTCSWVLSRQGSTSHARDVRGGALEAPAASGPVVSRGLGSCGTAGHAPWAHSSSNRVGSSGIAAMPVHRPHNRHRCQQQQHQQQHQRQQWRGYATTGAAAGRKAPAFGRDAAGTGGNDNASSSSASDGATLPLRAALRVLYRRVHPDLFHSSPAAKEENERSFKLLTEYLQLAHGGEARSVAARLPYRFVFYLRDERDLGVGMDEQAGGSPRDGQGGPDGGRGGRQQQQQQGGRNGGAADAKDACIEGAGGGGGGGAADVDSGGGLAGLRRVAVTLPPPAISPQGSRALAAPTRKALVKLLAACGVASSGWEEGDGAGGGEGAEGDGGGGPLSLAAFLPEAVEELRKAEAARGSDPAVRVANLRGALRLHRRAMASFSDKTLQPGRQAQLLERLLRLLDGPLRGLDVAGTHIVMGDRMGLDRLGHLCLAAGEGDDAWAAFLGGVDMGFVRQQRKVVEAVRALEGSVARAVGVAQIYTTYGNLTEPSYKAFLERLAAAAAEQGPVGGGGGGGTGECSVKSLFADVSLCVLPDTPGAAAAGPQGEGSEAPCRADPSAPGVLQLSCGLGGQEAYGWVARTAGEAQRALAAAKHAEGSLQRLAERTRLQLRLRSLTRDPRVGPGDFTRACELLLEQSAALAPLLEGCALRVGFANRLAPAGDAIEIAHNCTY